MAEAPAGWSGQGNHTLDRGGLAGLVPNDPWLGQGVVYIVGAPRQVMPA